MTGPAPPGLGQQFEILVGNDPSVRVQRDATLSVGRAGFDVQNLAISFHVHILAGWDIFQLIFRPGFARNVPDPP